MQTLPTLKYDIQMDRVYYYRDLPAGTVFRSYNALDTWYLVVMVGMQRTAISLRTFNSYAIGNDTRVVVAESRLAIYPIQ